MRIAHIHCQDRRTAWRRAPWAAVVIKCEGGFVAFESVTDAVTWKAQK